MHEFRRILVERNNELARRVIIIHMFDKQEEEAAEMQPAKRAEEKERDRGKRERERERY